MYQNMNKTESLRHISVCTPPRSLLGTTRVFETGGKQLKAAGNIPLTNILNNAVSFCLSIFSCLFMKIAPNIAAMRHIENEEVISF